MTPFPLSMRRVLATVIALDRPRERDVAQLAGLTHSATRYRLCQLRGLGLVAWEPGRQGTLRALVTVESVAS